MTYFGHTGGVIAAASKRDAVPLLQVGSIPIVRRIVITLQQAGVFPIVIVTGAEEYEVTHQLAQYGVVFLSYDECAAPQLLDSARRGLSYLDGKCDRVVFTPVNAPMFTPGTLRRLLACDAPVVAPSYQGRGGHPIVIRQDAIEPIMSYQGRGGLRGAMDQHPELRRWVDVNDPGVLMSVHDEQELRAHLQEHNNALLSPSLQIGIEKEGVFFSARLELLLFMIADLGSVRQACLHTGISYAKAWDMVNQLEREVGYPVVERQHGGRRGGHTSLTAQGEALMRAYQRYEQRLRLAALEEFDHDFRETGLM